MPDRILLNQPGDISATWELDGAVVDPGTVTVTITRDSDGSTVVSGAATSGTGAVARTYTLTPAQTAQLDLLKAVWTSGNDGSTVTTYAEVVGGYLFSIAQARLMSPLQDTATYPTEQLLLYRVMAETALEDICGVSFVPRYTREQAHIASYGILETSRRLVRTVRQITTWQSVNGVGQQVPLPTLAGYQVVATDQVFMPVLWSWWSMPIYIAYEHGYNEPPPRVGRAALLLARRWIVESPWDERLTGFRSREGGEMTILTASHTNAFDLPEVEAIAELYSSPMVL